MKGITVQQLFVNIVQWTAGNVLTCFTCSVLRCLGTSQTRFMGVRELVTTTSQWIGHVRAGECSTDDAYL